MEVQKFYDRIKSYPKTNSEVTMQKINRSIQKEKRHHKLDDKDEEDKSVVKKVAKTAAEFNCWPNSGLLKNLTKDISPSQTSLRKPVGTKDADNYYIY